MKAFLYLILFGLVACGGNKSSVDYGKTKMPDLVATKGEPIDEKEIPLENSKILIYPDNEKYQVKDDTVTHGFKDPKGDEKSLIYWKHKFKDCETKTRKISEPKGHELPEFEFKCPALGRTVIYVEGSEYVLRIIEHETE